MEYLKLIIEQKKKELASLEDLLQKYNISFNELTHTYMEAIDFTLEAKEKVTKEVPTKEWRTTHDENIEYLSRRTTPEIVKELTTRLNSTNLTKFVNNCKDRGSKFFVDKITSDNFFTWSETPEGSTFWSELL